MHSSLAVTVIVCKEELVRTQKIISLIESGKIQVIPVDGDESLLDDLPITKQSLDSMVPIGRSDEVNILRIASKLPEYALRFELLLMKFIPLVVGMDLQVMQYLLVVLVPIPMPKSRSEKFLAITTKLR